MARKLFVFLIFALFFYISTPLLVPLGMGGIFAVLFFPAVQTMERWKIGPKIGAAIITIGFSFLFLIPAATTIYFLAKTGLQQIRQLQVTPQVTEVLPHSSFFENLVRQPGIRKLLEKVTVLFQVELTDLATTLQDLARTAGLKLADLLAEFVTRLPGMVMALVIVIMSIYFFLVDGPRLIQFLKRNSFFTAKQTDQLIQSIGAMCRSVILATVVSGLVQALLEMIFLGITRTPNVALIGVLVFLCSFIPLIGSAPVTIGVALHQLITADTVTGVVLLVSAGIVGTVDNFVRPVVLKGGANLHPLLAFVAAFGGLQVLGVSGIFLGPIIAGIFVVILRIVVERESAPVP